MEFLKEVLTPLTAEKIALISVTVIGVLSAIIGSIANYKTRK